MKKGAVLLLLHFALITTVAVAQKFGHVDMEFVASKMPEFQKAQTESDRFSEKWAKDIQDKYTEIERMQKAYLAEEILLTDDLKRKRQNEITDKEREAREYNNKIFGFEGLLFQKKKEMMKPILETVGKAMEKVCAKRKLDYLFDKSSDFVIVYSNPQHDYTDYVLDELGLNKVASNNKLDKTGVNAPATPPQIPDADAKDPKINSKTTKPKQ